MAAPRRCSIASTFDGYIVRPTSGRTIGGVVVVEYTTPTIDLTPLRTGTDAGKREVARQIDEACRDTGFFLVTGHGVPADLIAKTRQRAIDFFALPDAEKLKVQRPPSKISRGYNWVGDRAIA